MSTHNMFPCRNNKKKISTFWMEKGALSGAMDFCFCRSSNNTVITSLAFYGYSGKGGLEQTASLHKLMLF